MATGNELLLTDDQHLELLAIAQSGCLPAGYVFRAKLILLLAEGASFSTTKQRFADHGTDDTGGSRVPGAEPASPLSLHAHLLLLAQPSRKLRRDINAYSANARPILWKYSDTSRRIRSNDFIATGH
jgi:hypothetical protein